RSGSPAEGGWPGHPVPGDSAAGELEPPFTAPFGQLGPVGDVDGRAYARVEVAEAEADGGVGRRVEAALQRHLEVRAVADAAALADDGAGRGEDRRGVAGAERGQRGDLLRQAAGHLAELGDRGDLEAGRLPPLRLRPRGETAAPA